MLLSLESLPLDSLSLAEHDCKCGCLTGLQDIIYPGFSPASRIPFVSNCLFHSSDYVWLPVQSSLPKDCEILQVYRPVSLAATLPLIPVSIARFFIPDTCLKTLLACIMFLEGSPLGPTVKRFLSWNTDFAREGIMIEYLSSAIGWCLCNTPIYMLKS